MKKITLFILMQAAVCQAGKLHAQLPDSLRSYVWAFIDTMQRQSLYANILDWKQVRENAEKQINIGKNTSDAESIIIDVFRQLNDHHGMYGGIDTSYRNQKPSGERVLSQGLLDEYKKPRSVKTMLLPGNIAYYKIPALLIGSDTAKMHLWANILADSLCKLEQLKPKAYIIDLRMNNGGNGEPMWQAIKGLVGEENRALMADAAGNIVPDDSDSAYLRYLAAAVPDRVCGFRKNIPVAVLIGPGTASSGEITATAFTTRSKSRLFGEPSIGLANVTNGFVIQEKGYILLTVAYLANAKKKLLKDGFVYPHETIKANDNYVQPASDPTVQAAMKWLHKQ